jgi:hypothetical protein
MKHTVTLNDVLKSGIVRVTSNGQTLDIPYNFRTSFSLALVESISIPCEANTLEQPNPITLVPPAFTADSSLGMHVILIANRTSGNRPLEVVFDARDSYFIAPDGTRFDCGACEYHWEIRKDGVNEFGPSKEPGNFIYTFGARGTYYVSVYVCRKGSTAAENCGGSGVQIIVQ